MISLSELFEKHDIYYRLSHGCKAATYQLRLLSFYLRKVPQPFHRRDEQRLWDIKKRRTTIAKPRQGALVFR
jgi:hypothetical protein